MEYPQSNGRAELGVKAAKRIIHNNVASDGSLNTDNAARALLAYRNTPLPDIHLSPAQILLHRNLRDGIPVHPSHHKMHKSWIISATQRERAYASRNRKIVERYNAHARELQPLTVQTQVLVQSKNKRWDRKGTIVEVLPHRQYRIRMSPSGRVTLRNRRFIRMCTSGNMEAGTIIPSATSLPVAPTTPTQSEASTTLAATPTNDIGVPIPLRSPAPSPPQVITSVVLENNTTVQAPVTLSSPIPAKVTPARVPLALRKLHTCNKPGLKEAPLGERR